MASGIGQVRLYKNTVNSIPVGVYTDVTSSFDVGSLTDTAILVNSGLDPATKYWFWAEALDVVGNASAITPLGSITTAAQPYPPVLADFVDVPPPIELGTADSNGVYTLDATPTGTNVVIATLPTLAAYTVVLVYRPDDSDINSYSTNANVRIAIDRLDENSANFGDNHLVQHYHKLNAAQQTRYRLTGTTVVGDYAASSSEWQVIVLRGNYNTSEIRTDIVTDAGGIIATQSSTIATADGTQHSYRLTSTDSKAYVHGFFKRLDSYLSDADVLAVGRSLASTANAFI